MNILVTGGAGFIGSNFVLYWLEHHPDDSIVNYDKLTYAGNLRNLLSVENNQRHRFIQGDICDPSAVQTAMRGADVVVHFAAESHVDRSIAEPATFIVTNVTGTQVLLDAAVKEKVTRFHHVSTDEVFGSLKLDEESKFSERTLYDPRSPYSASKAASDHLVRAYAHTYGLPVTITNCTNNFGPFQFPEKFIALAVTNLLEGKKIPVYGSGKNVRDWLYVDDHCRAIDAVLTRGKIGETYCVGGMTQDIANIDVIRLILKHMGKDESSVEFVKDRPGHDLRYAMDWNKIYSELGWEPQHDFEEWLVHTIEWYKKNEAWWKDVKSGAYQEYYKKQYGS